MFEKHTQCEGVEKSIELKKLFFVCLLRIGQTGNIFLLKCCVNGGEGGGEERLAFEVTVTLRNLKLALPELAQHSHLLWQQFKDHIFTWINCS